MLICTEFWARYSTYNDSEPSTPTGSPIDRANQLTSPQWPKRITIEGISQQFHIDNNSLSSCFPTSGFPSPRWNSVVMTPCYHFLFFQNEQRNDFLSATHYDWPHIIEIFGGQTARNWEKEGRRGEGERERDEKRIAGGMPLFAVPNQSAG